MKCLSLIFIFCIILPNEIDKAYNNKLLFCLKSNIDPLSITRENDTINTNLKNLNDLLSRYKVLILEQWLNGATENDKDGDIYLNRIYRIITQSNKKEILVSDVSNLAIVDTEDALLVTNLDSKLNFKDVLKNAHIKNKYTTNLFHRPWGHYSNLLSEPNVLVKQITIYPRSSMSLQRHFYRSEHWTILSGKGYVTVGNTRKLYKQNQSVSIEKKVKHRLENPFKKPLEMIEVQIGEAISEKDIERFDEIYDRIE